MPSMPISLRASFTSSSLNGLMIASIFFICWFLWLHRALVHASPQSRCGDLSNADAKGGLVQKTAGFIGEIDGKNKINYLREAASCCNLRSGEKFGHAPLV